MYSEKVSPTFRPRWLEQFALRHVGMDELRRIKRKLGLPENLANSFGVIGNNSDVSTKYHASLPGDESASNSAANNTALV